MSLRPERIRFPLRHMIGPSEKVASPPSGNRDRIETRTDRPFAARLESNRRGPRRLQSFALRQCVNARPGPIRWTQAELAPAGRAVREIPSPKVPRFSLHPSSFIIHPSRCPRPRRRDRDQTLCVTEQEQVAKWFSNPETFSQSELTTGELCICAFFYEMPLLATV